MATFGKLTNGASATANSQDRIYLSTATPASSGTVTSITGRTWISADSTPYRGAIYADSTGNPGALLAVSDEATLSNTSEQENTLNFSGANQISIVSGTPYWIGFHFQDPGTASWNISRDNTSGVSRTNTDTYSDGTANPYVAGTSPNGPADVYVTYTEAGAAATHPGWMGARGWS